MCFVSVNKRQVPRYRRHRAGRADVQEDAQNDRHRRRRSHLSSQGDCRLLLEIYYRPLVRCKRVDIAYLFDYLWQAINVIAFDIMSSHI